MAMFGRFLGTSFLVAMSVSLAPVGASEPTPADTALVRVAQAPATDAESLEKALDAALAKSAGETPAPPSTSDPPAATPDPQAGGAFSQPLLAVPRSTWRAPPDDGGLSPLRPPATPVLASNGGVGATRPGASRETTFDLGADSRIDQVMTYHYGARTRPGTIALRHDDGTVYGPWQAAGAVGQGNVPYAYWWVRPEIPLKAGHYTVIDSDPATWSTEASTAGAGIFVIWGAPAR